MPPLNRSIRPTLHLRRLAPNLNLRLSLSRWLLTPRQLLKRLYEIIPQVLPILHTHAHA